MSRKREHDSSDSREDHEDLSRPSVRNVNKRTRLSPLAQKENEATTLAARRQQARRRTGEQQAPLGNSVPADSNEERARDCPQVDTVEIVDSQEDNQQAPAGASPNPNVNVSVIDLTDDTEDSSSTVDLTNSQEAPALGQAPPRMFRNLGIQQLLELFQGIAGHPRARTQAGTRQTGTPEMVDLTEDDDEPPPIIPNMVRRQAKVEPIVINSDRKKRRKDKEKEKEKEKVDTAGEEDAEDGIASRLQCPICCEGMGGNTYSTKCGHVFCYRCIRGCVRTHGECPICRTRLTLKDVHQLFLP